MKLIYVLFILVMSFNSLALEIDEKLTVRVIGVSESKKTILVNRGIEDGLAVGDHAKFFVSVGVVSRGVVIKTSPTRSVWSLYRLVNKSYIREEQVLKLKITPAVKITKDESKMLVKDDTRDITPKDPRDLGIPLAEGADDLNKIENMANTTMGQKGWEEPYIDLLTRNREVFGMLRFSTYTEKTSPDSSEDDHTQDVTNLYFKIGGEWYFKRENEWYTRVSFLTHFAIDRQATMSHQGSFTRNESSEFGFGINLHPTKRPSKIHTMIPYLNYTLTIGSTNSTYDPGREEQIVSDSSLDASVFAHNVGFGYKYYTTQGLGMRAEFAYYIRGEDYAEDETDVSWVKTVLGPRLLLGLSYRL